MRAMLFFHGRSGIRMGLRAAAPLIAFAIGWTLFQDSPASFIDDVARVVFAGPIAMAGALPIVLAFFVLPRWAAPRLSYGSNGWLRQLPVSSHASRRAMLIALVAVQLPVAALLAMSVPVAVHRGAPVLVPTIRWSLVLVAGACAALPVRRRRAVIAAAVIAALIAMTAGPWGMIVTGALLVATDAFAGSIVSLRRRRPVSGSPALFGWRIGWRAIGASAGVAYAPGLLAIVAGWLFVENNALTIASAGPVLRTSGGIACVVCIRSLATGLARRRAPWPFSRSLPWSARQRVLEDSVILAASVLPFVILLATVAVPPALEVAGLVPALACRAAGYVRRIGESRHAAARFLCEGILAALVLAVQPLTAVVFLAAAPLALRASTNDERRFKMTRWSDWQLADELSGTLRGRP